MSLGGSSPYNSTDKTNMNKYTQTKHIVSAPWYIRNNDLHRDLEVDAVSSEIQRFAQKHEERLHHHENGEAMQLLDNMGIVRRLQRKKNFWASLNYSVKVDTVLV